MPNSDLDQSFTQSQVFVDLAFRNVNRQIQPLSGTQALVDKTIIHHRVNEPAYYEVFITSKVIDYYDKLITTVMASGTPSIFIRIGLAAGNDRTYFPWQEHVISTHSATPYLDGHRIWLRTGDALFKINRADTKNRIRSGRVSDIVLSIAQENSLEAVVEPTQEGQFNLVQSNESDVNFILTRLLPRALNEKGRGNYRLFIKDNILHFHSPDYQAEVKTINFFSKSVSTFLKMLDSSQLQLKAGAAGVVGLIYDPYTGIAQTIQSDPTKLLNFSKVTPNLSSIPNGTQVFPYHLGTARAGDAVALVQNKFEMAYSQLFELELNIEKMPYVQVNDVLVINIKPSESTTSPWSGPYTIISVDHVISSGTMKSAFILRRGEMSALGSSLQALRALGGVNASRQNFVVGQPLNLAEIRSSTTTRGGQERLSTGEIVKTVTSI